MLLNDRKKLASAFLAAVIRFIKSYTRHEIVEESESLIGCHRLIPGQHAHDGLPCCDYI